MKIKKISSLFLMSLCAIGVFAQEKKTVELPKAGDIGLGINVVPVLEYVGNMFATGEGRVNTLASFGGEETLDNLLVIQNPNVSIMGKYMLTDEIAVRVNLGVLSQTDVSNRYSVNDEARFLNPLSEDLVQDTYKRFRSGGSVTLGAEYRLGKGRIQGFGGVDLVYGYENYSDEYTYGNAVSAVNQTPTRTAFGAVPVNVGYWTNTYVKSRYNDGATHYVGLDVRLGVEYFIASQLSIGGEVSLYAIDKLEKSCYQIQEGFNFLNDMVETRTELISPGDRSFSWGTDNLGGKLFMMFYF